jgi:hypothetical protein
VGLFVPVVPSRARGVTKGVHYIAFLAGAHQNDNFNLEKIILKLFNNVWMCSYIILWMIRDVPGDKQSNNRPCNGHNKGL